MKKLAICLYFLGAFVYACSFNQRDMTYNIDRPPVAYVFAGAVWPLLGSVEGILTMFEVQLPYGKDHKK